MIEVITCIAASTLPIRNALREGIKPAFERGLVLKVLRSLSVIAVNQPCVSAIWKSLEVKVEPRVKVRIDLPQFLSDHLGQYTCWVFFVHPFPRYMLRQRVTVLLLR